FAKLINDMRNIKMTMSKLQLNSKFVNNMLPECGRFVTAVKLNRGLRDSNYDQLFAYLKQYEAHAMEKKMLLERLSQPTAQPTADPLALLSNAKDCDAFDSDVDETPTAQTMFIANLSSADPVTDEAGPSYDSDILSENKVAIGYKIPLCLTRTKQAQSALYNGHEILKDNHAPAKVYNAEDTLEIAEITRKKMNAKMTDPECVTHKVKIASHDYSKENLLATFTSQKQLTPEQIYWSSDLMKLKSEALKERAKASRPIKAFTVITPTELTDGERGFEQTKACYLQEVIPFFKTIKDNFEGIQKALTKEVKEMKDVFEELEAEVAQYVEPIIPGLRNNRDAHLDYLRNLKESVETIRDIVKEAKVLANTPLIKKKQVTIAKPSDRQDSNKQVHVVAVKPQKTNVLKASGSHPKSNPKTNRIPPAKGANKLHIEDLLRTNKSHLKTTNHVDSSSHLKRTVINSNLDSMCRTCNKCLTSFDHDMCVAICMKSVVRPHSTHHNCKVERKIKQVWKPKQVKRKMKQVERNTLSTLSTIGDLKFQTLHLCLVSNAGRTDCPLFDSGMTTLVLSWFMEIMRLVKASSPGYTVWKD
nr:hypothetical protein [Tanacetum cinerariifolium]